MRKGKNKQLRILLSKGMNQGLYNFGRSFFVVDEIRNVVGGSTDVQLKNRQPTSRNGRFGEQI